MGSDFFHAERQADRQKTQMKLRDAFRNFVNATQNFSNANSDNKFYLQSMLLMKLHGKKQQNEINLQACTEMMNSLQCIILFHMFLLNLWLCINHLAPELFFNFSACE